MIRLAAQRHLISSQLVPTQFRRRFQSANSFKSGYVQNESFQLKSGYHLWRPPDKYMEYRLVRYVYDNVFIIATYQLVLEFGLTVVFGLLLWNKVCTGEDVKNWLQAHHYPFYDWVELENTEFADPVMVGPLQLNSGKLTAAYTGHNIASGLLPAQVLFLILTFPAVLKGYNIALKMSGRPIKVPTPAPSALHKAKEAATPQAATAPKASPTKTHQRKPSYLHSATPSKGKKSSIL